jgi:hypothetical protein
MDPKAEIEKRFTGALATLRCHLPFTPEYERLVLEIFSDDTELKKSFSAGDQEHTICLLAQKWEALELALISENIIRRPLLETYETAYLAVAMEEVYRNCKNAAEKKNRNHRYHTGEDGQNGLSCRGRSSNPSSVP